MEAFERFKKNWPHTWWSIKAAAIMSVIVVLAMAFVEWVL